MKILLIDTGFSSLPIYNSLCKKSDDVWVMGNRAHDVIARLAGERWIQQDYSNILEVRAIVDSHHFDFIVPGCTDVSMDTCIKVTPDNPLRDSLKNNDILNTKSLFRAVCSELDLPCPQPIELSQFPLKGNFICKPVDGYSGNGVSTFDGENQQQLEQALEKAKLASPSQTFLIENYIIGQLHSCTGFVQNGQLNDVFFVCEGSSVNPYAVDTSYVVQSMLQSIKDKLVNALNTLSRHLELKDGLLHTQFILSDAGPMIIEITRRCPGDLYSLLIEYSTGYAYAEKYTSYHINEKCNTKIKQQKPIVRHTVTADKECIFDGLHTKIDLNIKAYYPLLSLGDQLLPNQKNRAALLFCETNNGQNVEDLFQTFIKRRAYKLG